VFDNPIGKIWLDSKANGVEKVIIDQEIIDEIEQRIAVCEEFPSFLESVRDNRTQ
jgi:hypothetical protein